MPDAGVEPDYLIVSTRRSAEGAAAAAATFGVGAESCPPRVAAVSAARPPPTQPVDERAAELRVERAVEEEVEREVRELQGVEDHPGEHHGLLVDYKFLHPRRPADVLQHPTDPGSASLRAPADVLQHPTDLGSASLRAPADVLQRRLIQALCVTPSAC